MSAAADRLRSVAVLMGGWSAEREVSLRTGRAVLASLERLGYQAWGLDVGRDLPLRLEERRPDVAFVALHGTCGEDGAVQGLLEVIGIPYTGSGVLASALAMNKKVSKEIFAHHGLHTPPWVMAVRGREPGLADLPFGLPAVVKPVAEGSTIGVSVVREEAGLAPALAEAIRRCPEALVEKYIPGRELTVGVLGRTPLPAVEIIAGEGFYDYQAKYHSAETRYVCPAEMTSALEERLAASAVKAVDVLGCRGQARVDFRVDPEEVPWILEVNTIPGMTETSLLPKAAAAAGYGFDELVEAILTEAEVPS